MTRSRQLTVCLTVVCAVLAARRGAALEVHDWTCFTVLQTAGEQLGHLNCETALDLPDLHQLANLMVSVKQRPAIVYGAPRAHPQATIRLDAGVIRVYPGDHELPPATDVKLWLHGGWLTAYAPAAAVDNREVRSGRFAFRRLDAETTCKLIWSSLRLGGEWRPNATEDPRWQALRLVNGARLRNIDGETETFLFYRGIGAFPAPPSSPTAEPLTIEVAGGLLKLGGLAVSAAEIAATLQQRLIVAGLAEDNAGSLIAFSARRWFETPGQRQLTLAPATWLQRHLPLTVSGADMVRRVSVICTELVSQQQQQQLQALADHPQLVLELRSFLPPSLAAEGSASERTLAAALAATDVDLPPAHALYWQLGPLREALLLHYLANHTAPALAAFARYHGITGYGPED